VSVSRRERGEQLDTGGDHVLVMGDEAPDLHVVCFRVDVQMTLD
jgi:hypothetical protein